MAKTGNKIAKMSSPWTLPLLAAASTLVYAEEKTGAEILTGKATPSSTSALVADPQLVLMFETAIGALVVAFIIVFFLGARANLQIARSVSETLSDCLSEQFAQIGTKDGKSLIKDGQSYFWFYATGRRHTTGLTVLMDLAKRMDIFSYTSSFMANPQKDRIVFFLPLSANVPMDPMSLFLVRKKELSRLRDIQEGEAIGAVESLAAEIVDVNGIPSDFVTMTEHIDIVKALLPEKIKTVVASNAKDLVSIHVTEQGAKWEPQCRLSKKLVRLEFTLPWRTERRSKLLHDMSQIALHLLDVAAEMKISAAARKKSVELRRKAAMEIEKRVQKARAEAAAERKIEKKKAQEEAVSQMTREQQRKYEEKKRKKEVQAKMRKVVARK